MAADQGDRALPTASNNYIAVQDALMPALVADNQNR